MKLIRNILILLSLFIHSGFALDGFWVGLEEFTNDYRSSSRFDEYLAQEYIIKYNSKAKDHAEEIVNNIVSVSACIELDAIYLLGKVHAESTFYIDAVSSSGAAGLSQMTGVAIQEVRDQLGIRGNSYARASVIKELTSNLKTCLGADEYNAFYTLHKDKTINQIKEVYKTNIKYSIFAGAIVLKVFMAKNYSANRSLRENYRLALEDYNGESTKSQYADNIIQKGIKIRELFKSGKL